MILFFLIGIVTSSVLKNQYEHTLLKKIFMRVTEELKPCLAKVEKSYLGKSSSSISDAVSLCIDIKSDFFQVSTLNVNGVIKLSIFYPEFPIKNLNLVPIVMDDLAEISGNKDEKINRWRCDFTQGLKPTELEIMDLLCDRLNQDH